MWKSRFRTLLLLQYRKWFIAFFEAGLVVCALIIAWFLRFDFSLPERYLLWGTAPILVGIRLIFLYHYKLLHGWWRYAGLSDAVDILKACALGSLAFFLLIRYALGFTVFPRSVYVIEFLLTTVLLGGIRFLSRLLSETARADELCRRVMVIGAGFAAQMVIRELSRSGSGYIVVGCVDDDPRKRTAKIHGFRVLGTVDELPQLLRENPVDEALIAVPSATGAQMRRFVEICEIAGLRFRTVPAYRDIISGDMDITAIRDVNLEDLLGRDPVQLDLESIRGSLENRVVMVTGAAGSIGSELCRQILDYRPSLLVCLDNNETGLFYLERNLAAIVPGIARQFAIGSVGDKHRLRQIIQAAKVEILFHAAAYKHVPMMEGNISQALHNNVFALLDMLDVAEHCGVRHFVLISSDKAVNPSSIMGASKRICELVMSSRPSQGLRCVSVRFGNVLGSNGSVVPLFQEQIRTHQPITVTHPHVQRFFMTIQEAVSLVLQAFAIGEHRDILVLDMGQPIRILDVLHTLLRISGKKKEDVVINFSGLRPGEKIVEELFYASEEVLTTSCSKVFRVQREQHAWPTLAASLHELQRMSRTATPLELRLKIAEIVPEYQHVSFPAHVEVLLGRAAMAASAAEMGSSEPSIDWGASGAAAGP